MGTADASRVKTVKALLRPGTYVGQAREAYGIARAVARYPGGMFDAAIRCGRNGGDPTHDTPVVLVHGYGHNRSGWFILDRHLRKAGFTSVHTVNYNPLRHDVPAIAARLAERVALIRAVSGADKVHIIGHSLGGIVLRWYAQELDGAKHIATAVTVASPHEGTIAALPSLLGGPFSRTGRELLPGSWVIRRLAGGARPGNVRWISYWSNLDLLIQPSESAKLRDPSLAATNILVKDHGHVSLMLSPVLATSIIQQLEAAEEGSRSVATLPTPAERSARAAHPAGPARGPLTTTIAAR
jgi:triacylglycerol esterase/lipase EstA (alpha/beta hydrolase family)